jgi:hypothetical protein
VEAVQGDQQHIMTFQPAATLPGSRHWISLVLPRVEIAAALIPTFHARVLVVKLIFAVTHPRLPLNPEISFISTSIPVSVFRLCSLVCQLSLHWILRSSISCDVGRTSVFISSSRLLHMFHNGRARSSLYNLTCEACYYLSLKSS